MIVEDSLMEARRFVGCQGPIGEGKKRAIGDMA